MGRCVIICAMNPTDTWKGKLHDLQEWLRAKRRVTVAFSGGKDSFFLVDTAVRTLGRDEVLVLFVDSGFTSENDRRRVEYFRRRLDFVMRVLPIDLAGDERIVNNSSDRCYHCKKIVFQRILEEVRKSETAAVLDGTTRSDLNEYRPGLRALEELRILSPLESIGITSSEVAAHLREQGIEAYFLTSSTCLATRFPYGTRLNPELIRAFDSLETFLVDRGIYPVRVRFIPDGVRIEIPPERWPDLLFIRDELVASAREAGFKFVTLDLEGIKSGVWD